MIIYKNVLKKLNTHFYNENSQLINTYLVLQFYAFSHLEIHIPNDQSTSQYIQRNP